MGAHHSLDILHRISHNNNNNKKSWPRKNSNNSNNKVNSAKIFTITDSEANTPTAPPGPEVGQQNVNPPPPAYSDANANSYENQPNAPQGPPPGYYAQQQGYPPSGYGTPPPGYQQQGYQQQGYPPPQGYPPASGPPPAGYYTSPNQQTYYVQQGGAYPPPGQNVIYYVPVTQGGTPPGGYGQGTPPGVAPVYIVQKLEDPRERSAFIQKVYSILFIQLATCFSFVAVCTFVPEVNAWVEKHYYLMLLFLFFYLACAIVMCCCAQVLMTTNACSLTLLIVLTLSMSGLTGFISSRASGFAVMLALGATMLAVLVLTLIAFQSSYDFTKWLGAMLVIFLIFILFGIFAIFLSPYIPFLHLIYSFLGAIIMSVYIVIDTQMLLSGKRYSLDTEMYIFAAIMLFVDIVLLFLYILDIVQQLDG